MVITLLYAVTYTMTMNYQQEIILGLGKQHRERSMIDWDHVPQEGKMSVIMCEQMMYITFWNLAGKKIKDI